MFIVVTRNFPPDVGGMQVLMSGLSESLLAHGSVKVFANGFSNSESYDTKSSLNIHRISGMKLFRKYRKAYLVNEFIKKNIDIKAIFFDHWKSLELINDSYLKKTKTLCLIHSKEINHTVGSWANKRLIKTLKKVDYIIANSKFTKELAIKIGIDKGKINIINPGINIPKTIENLHIKEANSYFNKNHSSKDSFPKIITIARLEKRKNHEKILMTIKKFATKISNN